MTKKFFAKKRVKIVLIATAILLLGGLVSAKFLTPATKTEYVTEKAVKKDLLQTVSEVGMVKADEEVKLGFSSSGKLDSKFVKVGDNVKAGYLLAQLDYKGLHIQRSSAESNLASARASLSKLLAGASASDLAVMEAQAREAQKAKESAFINLDKIKKTVAEEIRQAEKTLNDLQSSGADNQTAYEQSVSSALTSLNNAKASYQKNINNSLDTLLIDIGAKLAVANTAKDNLNTILTDRDLKDYLSSKDKTYLDKTKASYIEAEALALSANSSLYSALSDKGEVAVKRAANDALAYFNKTSEALNNFYSALENSTISQPLLDAHKANISSQLSAVNLAISVIQGGKQAFDGAYLSYNTNVSAAENALRAAEVSLNNAITTAKNALASTRLNGDQRISSADASAKNSQQSLEVVQSQLAKLKSSARSEDVALANAQVSQAQSALDLVNKQIEDSILKAPIDGNIVKDNFERGEQITPGQTVFSLLGENNYQVDVDISESDITKVKKGDQAEITLDAFGEDRKFQAVVDFIEPAQTVIQDVVYYKVSLKFSDSQEQLADVKPGMTANIKIITAKQPQVLTVSERAIVDKAGQGKIIRILRNGKVVESPVKVGLKGDGGLIEVVSGVVEGDDVVVFVKTNKK